MKLVETLKRRLGNSKSRKSQGYSGLRQHIYKIAASGSIPSFRISGSVRFDPHDVAAWRKQSRKLFVFSRDPRHPTVAWSEVIPRTKCTFTGELDSQTVCLAASVAKPQLSTR
jgi:hypothetical protein